MLNKRSSFSLLESTGVFMFLAIGYLAMDLYSGVLMLFYPQIYNNQLATMLILELFIYIPALIYIIFSGVDVKKALRIKKMSVRHMFTVIGIMLTGYIIVTFIGMLWTSFLISTGANLDNEAITQMFLNNPEWLIVLAVVVAAPIFEEMTFRGMILSGFASSKSVISACILTGILFGLFHANPVQIVPAAFLGFFIAYVVIKTGSIWAGLLYHFLQNLLSYLMVIDDYIINLPWTLNLLPGIETEIGAAYYFVYLLVLTVISTILLVILMRSLKKRAVVQDPMPKSLKPSNKKHLIPLFIGLFVVLIRIAIMSLTLYLPIELY